MQTGARPSYKAKEQVTVRIKVEGKKIRVSPYTVVLSKEQLEEIEWDCVTGEDFTVTFKESPFESREFTKRHRRSGLATVPSGLKQYKYTVRVSGVGELDPQVIIDR